MAIAASVFGSSVAACANPASSAQVGAVAANYFPRLTEEMLRYSRIHYALYFVWILFDTVIAWVFLQLGWAMRLRAYAQARSKFLLVQVAIFVSGFLAYQWLTGMPLSFYSSFWLEHQFGLSNQTCSDWLLERAKHLFLGVSVEIPLWWLLYKTLRRFPRNWPFVLFGVSVPIILSLVFLAPLIFDPIFNKFTALADSPLRNDIKALAAQSGLPDAPIFVSDRSKQTNKINAYVTGIGSSARIVIWDTTLRHMPEDQVLSVVAHELGHYVLKHVYWGCALAVAISLACLPVNLLWTRKLFAKLPARWGIQSLDDLAGMPALVLIATLVTFLADPAINAYSRQIEHEADRFGLTLRKDGPSMARTFVALSQQNLSEPEPPPLIEFWLFSHPSLKKRIEFVLQQP